MNVTHDALIQNCIIGSAPLNRKAARAPDKKSFKWHLVATPEPLTQNQNYFTELSLYQKCTNGYAPLNKRAARAPDEKYL